MFSFTVDAEVLDNKPSLLEAVIDTNILIYLHTRVDQAVAQRSQILVADHVQGPPHLVVTDGLDRELQRHSQAQPQPIERRSGISASQGRSQRVEDLFRQLEAAAAGRALRPGRGRSVADGSGSGRRYRGFLTWDEGLRAWFKRLHLAVPHWVDSVVRKDVGRYCVTFTDSRLVPGEAIPTTAALNWDRFIAVPTYATNFCDNAKAWADSGFTLVIN
ncbi:hypothetical protein [Actinokineospora diospyrosa]|uniref:hypothetical protein n=1 Tax=Actinokineospora diospyrosa TaxID=103728 RepID=UPI0020A31ACC|nr:hypothetical protein [Actinokineospora diospyrosa]